MHWLYAVSTYVLAVYSKYMTCVLDVYNKYMCTGCIVKYMCTGCMQ